MKTPPVPTVVEKVTGNVVVETAATVVAALAGGPLAAMLPVLGKSLASERQKARVEQYLVDVSATLNAHETLLRELSDAQYKLINEAVLASLQTTQSEKLQILRVAVQNALHMKDVEPQEAILLSRIIRDISPEEAAFVVKNYSYKGVHVFATSPEAPAQEGILRVEPGSRDSLSVSGLLSLGVLTPGEPTWDAPSVLNFSGIVGKVIALLGGINA